MDNIKATAHQFSRVTPSQSGAKERDEGFVASRADAAKSQSDGVTRTTENKPQSNQAGDIADRRSNVLVEQRKQDLAKQISAKEKTQEQLERSEELSAQRQLESRASANKQKIKNSYDAVQQSNNQRQAEDQRAQQTETTNTHQTANPEPINLVV